MQIIQLQYADQTPQTKILDDLTVLSRNTGQKGLRATAGFSDDDYPGLRPKLTQRQVPHGSATTPDPDPLPGNQAVIENGDTVEVDGVNATLAVSGNSLTGASIPSASAVISNGATVTVGGVSATLAVSGNNLTGASIPATAAVVTNGATYPVDGGTVTLAVSGGNVTATFEADD